MEAIKETGHARLYYCPLYGREVYVPKANPDPEGAYRKALEDLVSKLNAMRAEAFLPAQ